MALHFVNASTHDVCQRILIPALANIVKTTFRIILPGMKLCIDIRL